LFEKFQTKEIINIANSNHKNETTFQFSPKAN
jgi:hypothetical protein